MDCEREFPQPNTGRKFPFCFGPGVGAQRDWQNVSHEGDPSGWWKTREGRPAHGEPFFPCGADYMSGKGEAIGEQMFLPCDDS